VRKNWTSLLQVDGAEKTIFLLCYDIIWLFLATATQAACLIIILPMYGEGEDMMTTP